MDGDDDFDWDEETLEKISEAEKLALSLTSSVANPNSSSITPYFPEFQPQQTDHNSCISYSPPRELSQRPIHVVTSRFDPIDDAKDQEIERLKRELGRASEQLTNLERECCELRNERNRKKEKLNFVSSHTAEEDTRAYFPKNKKLKRDPAPSNHVVPYQLSVKALESEIGYQTCSAASSKAIGIQTDETGEPCNQELDCDILSQSSVSNKLLRIWSSASDQKSGRYLLSKLLTACPRDFHFIFGCMSMDTSEVLGTSAVGEDSCNAPLQHHLHSFHSSEAERVSHLYSVLTQIGTGFLPMESLLGPLIELSNIENVDILCCSLSILHVFLKHLFNSGRKLEERDSVQVKVGDVFKESSLFSVNEEETSCAIHRLSGTLSYSDPPSLFKKRFWNLDNWVSLFNLLHDVSKTKERARLVAVSSMNVILHNTNAYDEREKFGQVSIFESIAQFLKKEVGSHVQTEALHLLYLLLNCPKLLNVFCADCEVEDTAENNDKKASNSRIFSFVLEGLANCIGGCGNSIQDVELRKRAVVTLAFLASSGKSGFEIMVHHKLHGGKNFLMLILQLLTSEMDVEASFSSEPAESSKARTLLMREALILLNRIVSNPGYSGIVLRVLTGSRDMASMTISIVSRFSQKEQILMPSDSITRQIRGSEIVDLARLLKKRVFAYLGDKIS